MLTIIYAFILAGILALPVLLLYLYDRKQKRKEEQKLFRQLVQEGLQHHLSFTSQEVTGRLIFGVDCIHRKMLVVEKSPNGAFATTLIDLYKVRTCAVKKHFATAAGTAFVTKVGTSAPSTVSLMIFTEAKQPFEILFYSSQDNSHREAAVLERKARHWEQVLLKLASPVVKRA